MKKTITVRAGIGRRVFFPHRVTTAPGARTRSIHLDEVAIVDGDDRFVLKRLRVGDLVVVKQAGKSPAKPKASATKKPESKE